MYQQYFGFNEYPFSIVPNSRFLYQSRRHKEAIFQLQAGLGEGGGFALLTGEVGTGKTTIAKAILRDLGQHTKAGLILNPTFSNLELLEAICDEFSLDYDDGASLKQLNHAIYQYLLNNHALGTQTLLVIDEAQHLSADVLEQLRLLTNLETESQKLLKVLLIGQPELQQKLQMPQLRQLAQRITGRYHLLPLNADEARDYIKFRLTLAGGSAELFSGAAIRYITKQTLGIPRLINLVCDAVLKRAYSVGEAQPSQGTVQMACDEVMSFQSSSIQPNVTPRPTRQSNHSTLTAACVGVLLAGAAYLYTPSLLQPWVQTQIEKELPPVADVEAHIEVFPASLALQLQQQSLLKNGMTDLYRVWGYQASVMDVFCANNPQSQFRCLREHASFEQLVDQNRPVLLTLNIDNITSYAVLYAFNGEQVELLVNDQIIQFDRQWLMTIWQGELHTIWKRYWDETLKPGMKGESVALLDEHLALLLGIPSSGHDQFDASLKQKVELFQRWQGLTVDGIAGQQTLRLLEKLSQAEAPQLVMKERQDV